MRRLINTILTMAAVVVAVVSCDIETSGNGDLDGMWHLRTVDTLATAGSCDMKEHRIYWSFQHDLMKLDDLTGNNASLLMRFNNAGGKLILSSPYIYNREDGDEPMTEEQLPMLYPFGVHSLNETYDVIKLSGSSMILQSGTLRLSFKKI